MTVAQEGFSSRYEELLETALQLFRQKGYHATSMQDIADGMGLRKASLYHYIAAKEDLLVAIYRRTIAEHTERISAISAGPGPASERLARAIKAHLESIISHADMFAVYLYENRSLPPAHQEAVRAASRDYRRRFEDIIREGIDSGEFKPVDPHVAALLILGACNWLPQWYSPSGRMSTDEITGLFTEVLLRGLMAQREGGAQDAHRGLHQADSGPGDFAAGVPD
nr:TetR/AcrR family transcriptional regulator [Bacillota bacterium]